MYHSSQQLSISIATVIHMTFLKGIWCQYSNATFWHSFSYPVKSNKYALDWTWTEYISNTSSRTKCILRM